MNLHVQINETLFDFEVGAEPQEGLNEMTETAGFGNEPFDADAFLADLVEDWRQSGMNCRCGAMQRLDGHDNYCDGSLPCKGCGEWDCFLECQPCASCGSDGCDGDPTSCIASDQETVEDVEVARIQTQPLVFDDVKGYGQPPVPRGRWLR